MRSLNTAPSSALFASRLSALLLTALVVALLAGCASFSFRTTFESEADLLAARGQPARIWDNDDGTRTFEYSTQPMGESCWMYTIDANGVIGEQLDVLEHRHHNRVQRGMTQEEVLRTLGENRSQQTFRRLNEVVWDWNVPNQWPGIIATLLNVHFVDGVVERTSYTYIYPNNGDDGGVLGFGPFGDPFFGHPFVGRSYWGAGYRYHRPIGSYSRWSHHGWIGWPYYW